MTEKAFKILMIANIIIESVFYICVTIAAIYFGKPSILAWYLLATMNYFKPAAQKGRDKNA